MATRNKFGAALIALFILTIISACSDGGSNSSAVSTNSATTTPPGDSTQGVVSANDFVLLFSEPNPTVFDDTNTYKQTTLDVTVTADDRNDVALLGQITVAFRTEWGSFLPTGNEGATCVLDSQGKCSIKWRSGDPSRVPSNCVVAFTAWTSGEEVFRDINDNGTYDDADDNGNFAEGFTDIPEPFLPTQAGGHDSTFTPGLDQLIDVSPRNSVYDGGDGRYNGAACSHTSLCGANSTIVWDTSYLIVKKVVQGQALNCS